MDKPKFLSGSEIVDRGITKLDSALPEVGLKDVVPNGSWLEQKQVQSALDARKHLIEVERIQKSGTISYAEWMDDVRLAKVTQKVGGYWQYLGHNVGSQLFLQPEEALFLIEVNCLKLTYNSVIVSLQQAYSLLLSEETTLKYKVYASLSRLGYKVFKHAYSLDIMKKSNKEQTESNANSTNEKCVDDIEAKDIGENNGNDSNFDNPKDKCDTSANKETAVEEKEGPEIAEANPSVPNNNEAENSTAKCTQSVNCMETDNNAIISEVSNETVNETCEVETVEKNTTCHSETIASSSQKLEDIKLPYEKADPTETKNKLKTLQNRKLLPCDNKAFEELFTNVPDLYQKQTVTITSPDEQYIPKNVFVNQISYVINMENVTAKKHSRRRSTHCYSGAEEVHGPHVPRVSDTANNSIAGNNFSYNLNPTFQRLPFRDLPNWRPREIFGTPWNILFMPRFPLLQRPPPPMFRPNILNRPPIYVGAPRNNHDAQRQRRKKKNKKYHLQEIKLLAGRLKTLAQRGNAHSLRVALSRLIDTFNVRYTERLSLTPQLDLVHNEVIVDTIQLEDEEEVSRKRQRAEELELTKYDENLDKLKQLALKLKDLEAENKSSSRLRRAFSNLIKKFNKSYDAELYVTDSYQILDRRVIVLDNSSDDDCVVVDQPGASSGNEKTKPPIGKKLKNPFHILKKLSEKQTTLPSCSRDKTAVESTSNRPNNNYSENITKVFTEKWLPSEEDFGRAEVLPKDMMYENLLRSKQDGFIHEFIRNRWCEFENWLEAKISFYRRIESTSEAISKNMANQNELVDSIVKPEDCTDMLSVLKKLSIIETHKDGSCTDLIADFDVYERNVKNFKKSDRPTPRFRVICFSESSKFPCGDKIAGLHAKYEDEVPILFAIVSLGSVSYLQIQPNDLPLYIPGSNDLA